MYSMLYWLSLTGVARVSVVPTTFPKLLVSVLFHLVRLDDDLSGVVCIFFGNDVDRSYIMRSLGFDPLS